MAKKKSDNELQSIMNMAKTVFGSMGDKEIENCLNYLSKNLESGGKKTRTRKSSRYTEEYYPHFQSTAIVKKFTLRITLKDIRPSIWRKVEVPSNITLRHLSELIIPLMGWIGYHLHHFRKGNDYYTPAYQIEDDLSDGFYGFNDYFSEDYTIADVLQEKGKSIELEYDFGDSWLHDVRLSSIADYDTDEPHLIRFVGGKRACPPEDCGGVWGYEEICEDNSEEYDYFDPEEFDAEYAAEICENFNKGDTNSFFIPAK